MMQSLKNLSWSKLRGVQRQDLESGDVPTAKEADTADKRESSPQLSADAANDTPHEAKPEQPTLVNRLFRKVSQAPKQPQFVDIEMGAISPSGEKF